MNLSTDNGIFNKDFTLLFIINFASHAGLQMFASVMSKYAVSLGSPDSLLGLIVSAYAFMIFATSLFSGSFIDRINKKTLLMVAMIGQCFAVLGYAFLAGSMPVLIALRLLHGLFSGLTMNVTMAMVAFALPKSKLGMGMGIYGLGQTIAMAVGPFIGIFLVDNVGFQNMFLIAFVLVTIAALLTIFVTSIPTLRQETKKIRLNDLILDRKIPVALLGFFNNTAYSSITAYLVLHADQRGVADIGFFFTVYSVVLLASRPLLGKISDRFALKTVIYPTSLISVAALLLCANASNIWMFLGSAVLMAIGFGGSQPVIQAACIRDVSPEKRGAASATFMLGQSLGFIVGPMLGGALAASVGYGNMYAFMAGVAFLSLLLMFAISLKSKISDQQDQTSIS